MSTSLLGVFISPISVSLLFKSSNITVTLDVTSILLELLLTIALPMAIGYVLSPPLLLTAAHPVVLYLDSKAGEAVLFIAEGSLFPVFVHGPLGQDERIP